MGYREIVMLVVALLLTGFLALAISPSISATGEATKGKLVYNEIESIVAAANLWAVNANPDGSLTGLSATAVSSQIPNLALNSAADRLKSKINSRLEYIVLKEGSKVKICTYDATSIYPSRQIVKDAVIAKYGSENWIDSGNDFCLFAVR